MKTGKVKHWLWLIGVLFATATAFPQTSHQIFEHLTTSYGLSSNKVEAIVQDDDGFYWIATQNGLNRFDGTHFKIFRHQPNDSTYLSNNNCTAIALDSIGDIWVATYNGVSRYRKRTGDFQRIFLKHPTKNHELANRIYHLAVDSTGNVWIAGNGLWKYDTRTDAITLFQSNKISPDERPAYAVIPQLQYDYRLHGLWLSTGNGVIFFDITTSRFYHTAYNPHGWALFDHSRHNEFTVDDDGHIWFRDQLSQCIASFDIARNEVTVTPLRITTGVRQIQADERKRIWIFYWVERALIYDPGTMRIDSAFFNITHEHSVLSELATSLYRDHYGNYWIASGSGISIYRLANQYYRLHKPFTTTSRDHVEPIRIQALAQSDPGSLWIGTSEGLYTYDLQSGQTQPVTIPHTAPGVIALLATDSKLWIGAHDMLTSIDPRFREMFEQVTLDPGIIFIRQDQRSHLWVGLWTRGLFQLDSEGFVLRHYRSHPDSMPGIAANTLIAALPDGDRLWIGYNGGLGFSAYEFATDMWKHFHPHADPDARDVSSNAGTVTVITKGAGDHLWIGTHGGGIFYANPAANTYKQLSQSSGLTSNYINSILADSFGHYWIATADGLNVLDTTTLTIRSLDVDLAFRDNDFRQNGIAGQDGKLYFFFNERVIEIDPVLYNAMRSPQRMVISSFTVFDAEQQVPDSNETIVLSYDENFFSFGFSVIKTHPLQKIQYAYRMAGFDKDWIYSDRPFANYTNVPHGRYTFQVKAMHDNGAWSEPLINIPMRIYPPFWLTWWFILLVAFSAMAIAYSIYHYRIGQMKKVMVMRAKISRDLHDEVGSALSSIHVYSSVATKAMDKNPTATRDALQVIHDNSRQVMENMGDIVWAINTGMQSEISLEKKLKNYGFELLTPLGIVTTYAISADAEQKLTHMEARKNILLIAKEAMNNIARYSKATTAAIELSEVNHQLQLRISDNGIGFDPDNRKTGNGLSNMRNRSMSLGGKCDIQSQPGQGTTITCCIPLTSIRER